MCVCVVCVVKCVCRLHRKRSRLLVEREVLRQEVGVSLRREDREQTKRK